LSQTPVATIALLSLAAFASAASLRVMDPLLPRLATEFNAGLGGVAHVITGFAIAYGVLQMVFGPLGDRFGKLRVISIACAAAALATSACAFTTSLDALVLARIVAGACCASVIPLAMAWIGDVVSYERRQPVLARFLVGQILGLAAGSASSGFAAEQAFWQWPFLAIGAWFAAISAWLWLAAARHERVAPSARNHLAHDLGEVLAVPWARVVLTTVFAEGVVLFGALAFIATHLHNARGMSLSAAGLIIIAFGVGGLFFALFASRFVRRLGEPLLSSAGSVFIAAGMAVVMWSPAAWVAPLGCFVAGLGFYMFHNTLQTNATQMLPARRGAAVALFASSFFIGQSIGVALAGLVAERFGTSVVITLGGIAVIPVGFTFATLHRRRQRRAAD
jgi:predicted MFS family arabinose efflux permease